MRVRIESVLGQLNGLQPQDVGLLKWRDLLYTTCNSLKYVFIGLLWYLQAEVLIISAFWEVSLMVVVFIFSGQMGDTICRVFVSYSICGNDQPGLLNAKKVFEVLERCDRKLSCTVLRGKGGRKAPALPGSFL